MSLHPVWVAVAVALLATLVFAVAYARSRASRGPARRAALRRLALAALVLVAAARPVFGAASSPALASDVDVLLLVDRTTSMAAEDHNGTEPRVRGVAHDVRQVAARYPGARFALVTFTAKGRVEMPFTTDARALVALGDTIQPEVYLYSRGSSISAGVETAARVLREAAAKEPTRTRHVIYLGDGEQTSDEPPGSFEPLRQYASGGAVLGYGTEAGGRMKTGISGSKSYVVDRSAAPAVSRIDEANLRRIAGELGVPYLHRTRPDDLALPRAGGRLAAALGGGTVTGGTETYWVVALGVFGLALWELWGAATTHRRLRSELGRTR